jgi:hypothetical protein
MQTVCPCARCLYNTYTVLKITYVSFCELKQQIVELEGTLKSVLQCLPLLKINYNFLCTGQDSVIGYFKPKIGTW